MTENLEKKIIEILKKPEEISEIERLYNKYKVKNGLINGFEKLDEEKKKIVLDSLNNAQRYLDDKLFSYSIEEMTKVISIIPDDYNLLKKTYETYEKDRQDTWRTTHRTTEFPSTVERILLKMVDLSETKTEKQDFALNELFNYYNSKQDFESMISVSSKHKILNPKYEGVYAYAVIRDIKNKGVVSVPSRRKLIKAKNALIEAKIHAPYDEYTEKAVDEAKYLSNVDDFSTKIINKIASIGVKTGIIGALLTTHYYIMNDVYEKMYSNLVLSKSDTWLGDLFNLGHKSGVGGATQTAATMAAIYGSIAVLKYKDKSKKFDNFLKLDGSLQESIIPALCVPFGILGAAFGLTLGGDSQSAVTGAYITSTVGAVVTSRIT